MSKSPIKKLVLSLALCYSAQTLAWEIITCQLPVNQGKKKHWNIKEYQVLIDPVSIPKDSPQYQAVLNAVEHMNANPSQFRYRIKGFDTNGVAKLNGESEIWMQDLGKPYQGVSAIEHSNADFSPDCLATESDIIINTHYRPQREPVGTSKISTSNDKNQLFDYGGSDSNLRSIVMHELGHTAGLQHEGNVMNLMGGDNLLIANGDTVEPYIGQDTASGLIALHGLAKTAKEEVSVNHWQYGEKIAASSNSFFSVHWRTKLLDEHQQELSKVCPYQKPDIQGALIKDCPEPIYQVSNGQTVYLNLSYENAGKSPSIKVKANYYLSTDNHIDTNDQLLKTQNLTLKRNTKPSSQTTKLSIPNNATNGDTYWLGCILDPDNTLQESNKANNATYLAIKVLP